MLQALIVPKTRDLGEGFMVRRALPAAEKRAVGPFVFFDQMGPVAMQPGQGMDVRPHPHIGLATVTYLYEGEILHRDSLGSEQPIRPGDVNWMTAGRGIVHSERTRPELRAAGPRVFGIQLWVALPEKDEETEPSFVHHPAATLPVLKEKGLELRVIIGELGGTRSPVETFSPMVYADAALEAGRTLEFPAGYTDRAAYVAEGVVDLEGREYPAGQLLAFHPGSPMALKAKRQARLLLLGGEPLGPRRMWWNFVHSRQERIAQAAAEWKAGKFPKVPGDGEFIPLPDGAPQVADYP